MGAIRQLLRRVRPGQASDGVAFGGIKPRVVSHKAMWGGDFAVVPRVDWDGAADEESGPSTVSEENEEDLRKGEFWFLEEGDEEDWALTNPGRKADEEV